MYVESGSFNLYVSRRLQRHIQIVYTIAELPVPDAELPFPGAELPVPGAVLPVPGDGLDIEPWDGLNPTLGWIDSNGVPFGDVSGDVFQDGVSVAEGYLNECTM